MKLVVLPRVLCGNRKIALIFHCNNGTTPNLLIGSLQKLVKSLRAQRSDCFESIGAVGSLQLARSPQNWTSTSSTRKLSW